jgi:hypothetical protein
VNTALFNISDAFLGNKLYRTGLHIKEIQQSSKNTVEGAHIKGHQKKKAGRDLYALRINKHKYRGRS